MSGKFNYHQWVTATNRRLGKVEKYLSDLSGWQQQGMSGADSESTGVLKRAIDTLRTEFLDARDAHKRTEADFGSSATVIKNLERGSLDVSDTIRKLNSRLDTLSYHVGVWDETVQGVSIRPERAVPATRINQMTGAPEVNPVKVHTKTFWLRTTPGPTVTIPANGQVRASFTVPPEQNLEGDLEIYYLQLVGADSTSFRVRLSHTGLGGEYLMNQPVHGLSVFGNMRAGPQPFALYETIFLQPDQELIIELFDFSGAPNEVELVAHGRKFIGYAVSGMDRRGLVNVFARNTWPYWLTSDAPVLLNAGVNVATNFALTVFRQYHAELGKVMQFGHIGGVPAPVPYHIQLNEGQSGNLIIDSVAISAVAGTSNFPIALPEPYLALRGTSLAAIATNDNGFANQSTDLVFHGRALPISYPGQQSLEPLLDGRNVQLPPAENRRPGIPGMVSM